MLPAAAVNRPRRILSGSPLFQTGGQPHPHIFLEIAVEELVIILDYEACGRGDLPGGYRVFSMPKLNIREQMAAYKEAADRAAPEEALLCPKKAAPER